jgi:hypothetical protein
MRDEAIVLLAAASSMAFLAAGIACAKPDVHRDLAVTSPYAAARGRPVLSPRMITWNVCSTTTDGSALSIYSSSEEPAQSLQGPAIREDVGGHQCADHDGEDEDNGADENPAAGVISMASTM